MTAVEWLEKICNDRGYHLMEDYFKQAKVMEREQIIEAVSRGWWNNENGLVSWIGEEYYNETYKKDKNDTSI
jgi:hypothetical protein